MVPNFQEFEKDPQKYMNELNNQPDASAEGGTEPTSAGTDSVLGAQAGTPTAQTSTEPGAGNPAPEAKEGAPEPTAATTGAGTEGQASEAGAEDKKTSGAPEPGTIV